MARDTKRKGRRGTVFEKVKPPLVIIYTTIAVIFNCWIISTFLLASNRPTVLTGTVVSSEQEAPVEGAVVGMRQSVAEGSREVTTTTNGEGFYRLEIPGTYEQYQVFCVYGASSGVIVNGPKRRVTGELKEGESEFQIVLHRRNRVDWEVSTR